MRFLQAMPVARHLVQALALLQHQQFQRLISCQPLIEPLTSPPWPFFKLPHVDMDKVPHFHFVPLTCSFYKAIFMPSTSNELSPEESRRRRLVLNQLGMNSVAPLLQRTSRSLILTVDSNRNFDHLHKQASTHLNSTTPDTLHFDPGQGNLTKQRPFTDTHLIEPPTLEVQEAQIKDAMLQHHQATFPPTNS